MKQGKQNNSSDSKCHHNYKTYSFRCNKHTHTNVEILCIFLVRFKAVKRNRIHPKATQMHGYSQTVEFCTLLCTQISNNVKIKKHTHSEVFYEAFINYGGARMMFLNYSDESHCMHGLNF